MAYLPPGNADQKVVVTSSEGATGTGVVRERAFYDPDGTRVKT
jgi:hypothetical protein